MKRLIVVPILAIALLVSACVAGDTVEQQNYDAGLDIWQGTAPSAESLCNSAMASVAKGDVGRNDFYREVSFTFLPREHKEVFDDVESYEYFVSGFWDGMSIYCQSALHTNVYAGRPS